MRVQKTKITALGVFLAVATFWTAAPASAAGEAAETSVRMNSLPTAVRQTVLTETRGATIRGVSKERGEDGVMVYEVETRTNGLNRDMIIGLDGTLLISEQQVRLAELPPTVRSAILKGTGKKRITLVESVTKGGKLVYYEAQLRSGKTTSELKVDTQGKQVP